MFPVNCRVFLLQVMLETYHKADSKNKVLSAWTKESVEQITRVSSTWDNYMSLMDNHEMIISKQVDAIKANLNTQVSGRLVEKDLHRNDG